MKIEENTESINLSTETVQNNRIEAQNFPDPFDVDAFKSALLGKNTSKEGTTSSFGESFPFPTSQKNIQSKNEVKDFQKPSNPSDITPFHSASLGKTNLKNTIPSISKKALSSLTTEKQISQTDKNRSTSLSKGNDGNILDEININLPIGNTLEGINKTPSEINTTQEVKIHSTLLAQQIKDQLIDRILVSSSDLNANKEVIVKIAPHLLQATEVHFSKNASMLNIQFTSPNQTSLQFLNANQLDLQAYLQNHLSNKEFSQIHIKVQEGNLSQPQDGRSRNRFEYQSPEEDTEQ